jgi:hypothetical protein
MLFAPVVGLYLHRIDSRVRRVVIEAIEADEPLRRAA